MQGKDIGLTDKEKYLGFILSSKGIKDSIKMTINDRIGKSWAKVKQIKNLLASDLVRMEGWLKAGLTLFQSYIPATMLYSCEMWFMMDQTMTNQLESAMKSILYTILEIPRNTKITAVFYELGLMTAKHIIQQRQITYVNHLKWQMRGTKVNRMLVAEWMNDKVNSVLGQVSRMCSEYGLPDVAVMELDNDTIRERIKLVNKLELWTDARQSRIVNCRPEFDQIVRQSWELPRSEARALLFLRTGALRVKEVWRAFNSTKYGNLTCPMVGCVKTDSIEHLFSCDKYSTVHAGAIDIHESDDKVIADVIVKLSQERFTKHRMSLI